MEGSGTTGIVAVTAVALFALVIIVLAYSGAFDPQGGGIHIGIGR